MTDPNEPPPHPTRQSPADWLLARHPYQMFAFFTWVGFAIMVAVNAAIFHRVNTCQYSCTGAGLETLVTIPAAFLLFAAALTFSILELDRRTKNKQRTLIEQNTRNTDTPDDADN